MEGRGVNHIGDLRLIESLRCELCPACARRKVRDRTFCRLCYYALPQQLQRDLYRKFGSGYEQAFDASVSALNAQALHWPKLPRREAVQGGGDGR